MRTAHHLHLQCSSPLRPRHDLPQRVSTARNGLDKLTRAKGRNNGAPSADDEPTNFVSWSVRFFVQQHSLFQECPLGCQGKRPSLRLRPLAESNPRSPVLTRLCRALDAEDVKPPTHSSLRVIAAALPTQTAVARIVC